MVTFTRLKKQYLISTALALAIGLGSCSLLGIQQQGEDYQASPDYQADKSEEGSVFEGGIMLFGNSDGKGTEGAVAVNAFLWRASLDTISFMPLSSADPFGGVIISDWYSPPETPDERFKVNVYILGRVLRADGLKVSVFRQIRSEADRWQDAAVGADVAMEFEDAVLTRARQLRMQAVEQDS